MQKYGSSFSKRNKLKNPYFKKSKPANWRLRTALGLLVLTALGWLYLFYFSPYFNINQVKVTGLIEIPRDDIISIYNDYASQNKLYVFKRQNIFIFKANQLENKICDKYSLDEIKIKKEYPNKLLISITEKTSSFIWSEAGYRFLVDKSGQMIKEYSEKYENLNLPYVIGPYDLEIKRIRQERAAEAARIAKLKEEELADEIDPVAEEDTVDEEKTFEEPQFNKEYAVGQKIITANNAQFIISAYESLIEIEQPSFSHFELPSTKEGRLNVVFKNNLKIYLNMRNNIDAQIKTLKHLITNTLKEQLDYIQYIDLRFGEQVNYK